MKKSDYEMEKIVTYYTILKKIVIGLATATLVSLFIRYNPDYDLNVINSDTISFFALLACVLYVLNQLANFIDEKRAFERREAELEKESKLDSDNQ